MSPRLSKCSKAVTVADTDKASLELRFRKLIVRGRSKKMQKL